MATTTTYGSLSVPAPDDTMEMSSPANRNLDDDIDIDFDDYHGGVQLTDDERMLEDGEQTRPTTANDDMMEDDVLPGEQVQVVEEVMRIDDPQAEVPQQEEDEELIDYSDEEFEGQAVDDTVIPEVMEEPAPPPEDVAIGVEQVDEEIAPAPEDASAKQPVQDETAETENVAEQILEAPTNAEGFLASGLSAEEGVTADADDTDLGEPRIHEAGTSSEEQQPAREETAEALLAIDTAVSATDDTPGTPTDTGLHPMNVRYGSLHIPLFKSRRQPDGLLKDDNLASLSLAELIQSCRQRLAYKIGENISEDQELVLGFDSMGLMLVEVSEHHHITTLTPLTRSQNSRAAFESSLNDVLDVYLQLHRNDDMQDVAPLSLNLSLQLKFASSFLILKQAAAGGQGMSSFSFLHPSGEDQDDYYHEEFEDGVNQDTHAQDGLGGDDHVGTTDGKHADEAAQVDHQEELYEPEQPTGEYDDQDYPQNQEDHNEEDAAAEEQDSSAVGLEGMPEGANESSDAVYNAPENLARTDVERPTATGEEAHGEVDKAVSSVSSQTVQGDSANGTAGEYEEEIDWEDNTVTSDFSEQATEGLDDFSTFLTEYDDDEHKIGPLTDDQHAPGDNAVHATAEQDSSLVAGEPDQQPFDAQNLGSEDFLDDIGELGHEEQAIQDDEHEYEVEYGDGEDLENDGQENLYQADTYDEQQDEHQSAGDDENFHTTQDVLDGEQYEHGPENDVYVEQDELDDTAVHAGDDYQEDGEDQEEFGDDLRFDEDDPDLDRDEKARRPDTAATSDSPLGKRSFDEIGELDGEEPDLKKIRPS